MINPKPLKAPTFFQNLFDKPNEANALIEVNNFLAQQRGSFVSVDQILKILEKYDINLYRWEKKKKAELFELFYLYNLQDRKFSNEESDELRTLKKIISLDDEKIYDIQVKIIADVYEKSIDGVLQDFEISEQERKYLDSVSAKLGISKNAADQLLKEKAESLLEKISSKMINDRRLDPKEEKLALELAQNLGVSIKNIRNFNQLLKYKLFWKIENGQMPIINTELKLTSGELCHHVNYINWLEHRTVTVQKNKFRSSNHINLAKNNYSNPREVGLEKKRVLKNISNGEIYITNKRVIYKNQRGIWAYRLDDIGDFKVYKNGVEIYTASGNHMFWEIEKNVDLFALILTTSFKNFTI